MRVDFSYRVAAPAEVVWRVVTDLPRYADWNPFVVACRSDLTVGAPIDMRVRLVGPFAMPQRERILAHEPGERLCYGLRGAFLGALSSERWHVVRDVGPGLSEYESKFELSGRLAPLVERLLGRRLRAGFQAMSDALVRRAEELDRAAG